MKEVFNKNRIRRVPKKERLDVLLIYPVWVKKHGRGKLQRMLPPLGVLSLAAYLEKHDYEVQVIDLHAEQLSPQEFRKIIKTLNPRVVGITVLSAHFAPANQIAHICKEIVSDVRVIVGGVHAESCPEQMLSNSSIDAVCRGDGEEPLLQFVRCIPLQDILGLSYRVQNADGTSTVKHNDLAPIIMDLDMYPFPAYHLIDMDLYFPPAGTYKDLPAINVLMTRGCPGKCTFCNSANTVLRRRSPGKMVELIQLLRYSYGIRHIYFYDDTFTANPKIVEEFCQIMIEKKVDVKWTCYARGDMFRESLVKLMAKAGCHHVMFGMESGSSKLLEQIGKYIDKEKYRAAVQLARKYKIESRGSFIVGHIEETEESLLETLRFALEIDLDFFQLNFLTPYPGTQLYEYAKSNDLLVHENYSHYGQGEVVLKLRNLSERQLMNFERFAFFCFYMRPKIILRQIFRLSNRSQLLDLMKAFYVLLLEGFTKKSSKMAESDAWLYVSSHKQIQINAKITPGLTWKVRQSGAASTSPVSKIGSKYTQVQSTGG